MGDLTLVEFFYVYFSSPESEEVNGSPVPKLPGDPKKVRPLQIYTCIYEERRIQISQNMVTNDRNMKAAFNNDSIITKQHRNKLPKFSHNTYVTVDLAFLGPPGALIYWTMILNCGEMNVASFSLYMVYDKLRD